MKNYPKHASWLDTLLIKGPLVISGLCATGIAATILLSPDVFYASYEIDTAANRNLVNELKAPAGMLLVAGLFMLVGVGRTTLTAMSLATATLVYLSYGLSRLLSIAVDGVPHSGLVSATAIELIIGVGCLLAYAYHRKVNVGTRITATPVLSVTSDTEAA